MQHRKPSCDQGHVALVSKQMKRHAWQDVAAPTGIQPDRTHQRPLMHHLASRTPLALTLDQQDHMLGQIRARGPTDAGQMLAMSASISTKGTQN